MNKKLILVLIVALAVANASNLQFDLQKIGYQKASDYWTVQVPCAGGSGNYGFSCQLPDGWKLQNNRFRIPSAHSTNYNFEYVSRCKVRDNNNGDVLERSLTFKCTQTGYIVSDHDYFYGQSSYSTGSAGSLTGLDVLKRLQNLGGSVFGGLGGFNAGAGSYGGLGGYTGGVANNGLPSWNDCDALIKNGDISELLALIQKVVESNTIKCDAKTAFLNDLLGRICSAIQIKKESVFQLKAFIDGLLAQINKLTLQIKQLKDEQASLNIDKLKKNLDELLAKLKAAYNDYNQCVGSTGDYEKQLATLKAQIEQLQRCIRETQAQLQKCKSDLKQINDQIAAYQAKLVELRKQRDQISKRCDELSATLKIKTDRLAWVRSRCQWLSAQIQAIQKKCSGYKDFYLKLEYDIKCLKEQIEKAECRYHEIDDQITSINIEIQRINGQVNDNQIKLKALQQCIENLNCAIKEIKQTIQYLQYHCNDCKNVVVDDDDNEACFKFGRDDWFQYMNRCYGAPLNQLQISFPQISISIKTINIFSPVFQQNYGSCFSDEIKSRGSQWDNQGSFGFNNDFQCSAGIDGVTVKKGKIRAINNKYIDVDCDDGQQARLKLGSCSRFEGQGKDFLPKAGQNIHWKGAKNVDQSFNLHSCSCY